MQETAAQLQFSVNRRTDAELCILKLCDETLSGDLAALGARIARLEEQIAAGVQFAAKHPVSGTGERTHPRGGTDGHTYTGKGRGSAHRERKARRGSAASVGRAAAARRL